MDEATERPTSTGELLPADPAEPLGPKEDALRRIEEARGEAAAMIIQHPNNEQDQAFEIESRIADTVHEAQDHPDAGVAELERLADETEAGRDELREEMFGRQHTG